MFKSHLGAISLHLILSLSTLSPLWALAEESNLNFDQVLEVAMDYSPLVQQFAAKISAEKADAITLEKWDNPELSAEVRPGLGNSKDQETEYEIVLSQPLRASNFGARQKLSALLAQNSELHSHLQLLEFEQSLRLSYGKAWALQRKEEFLKSLLERSQKLSRKMHGLSQSGLIAGSTQKLLSVELKKLQAELGGLEGDLQRAFAELLQKTGNMSSYPRLSELTYSALPTSIDSDFNKSQIHERIKLKSAIGREQANLAKLDSYPQFAPRLGFERTADGDERILVGFSVGLPFFDRNQGQTLKSTSENLLRESESRYFKSGQFSEELKYLLSSARATEEQSQIYKIEILPALDDAYVLVERETLAGQASPLQLWQILTELRSQQDRYLELWIKALALRSEFSIIAGKSY